MANRIKYLDPTSLVKLGKLHLRAKYVVEGLVSGLHQSPYKGYSLEFSQHREYSFGDELKHIDWKVYGRTDKFFIKQFDEETNLRAYILLDISGSMSFKSEGQIDKLSYGINLVACLSYLLLRQEDSVGLSVFSDNIKRFLPPRAHLEQFSAIIDILEELAPDKETRISQVLNEFGSHIRKRGLIIIISDLFDRQEDVLRSIKQFRYKHHDVIIFHLVDPMEKNFNFTGPVIFESLENQDRIQTETDDIQEKYKSYFDNFLEEYKIGFHGSGIDYHFITTDTPIETSLMTFLSNRKK